MRVIAQQHGTCLMTQCGYSSPMWHGVSLPPVSMLQDEPEHLENNSGAQMTPGLTSSGLLDGITGRNRWPFLTDLSCFCRISRSM